MAVRDIAVEEIDVRSASDEQLDELTAFENVMRAESHPDDPPMSDAYGRADLRTLPEFIVFRWFLVRGDDGSLVPPMSTVRPCRSASSTIFRSSSVAMPR